MLFLTHRNIVWVPWAEFRTFGSLYSGSRNKIMSQFVVLGRLHLRPLQMALFIQWKPHVLPLEHPILFNAPIRNHLEWWNTKDHFIQGMTLISSNSLFTDTNASLSGWSAHLEPEGLLFHDVWSLDQPVLHINIYSRDESYIVSSKTVLTTC